MQDRRQHQPEVQGFLQKHFLGQHWRFALPIGSGNETYFAYANDSTYFVKLGVQIARYQAMASLGLSPPVLAAGYLEDGISIVVQPYIAGRNPSRKDYRLHLEQIAAAIHRMHHSPELQRVLPRSFLRPLPRRWIGVAHPPSAKLAALPGASSRRWLISSMKVWLI